jgi:hypothetical protein
MEKRSGTTSDWFVKVRRTDLLSPATGGASTACYFRKRSVGGSGRFRISTVFLGGGRGKMTGQNDNDLGDSRADRMMYLLVDVGDATMGSGKSYSQIE